jgi:hypothetical protein
MRSLAIFIGILASASLISALPQATPTPQATDVYTGTDVDDAWPGGDLVNTTSSLRRRGSPSDGCEECEPTPRTPPPCDECEKKKRYKGSIYVKCEDCDDEECCKCIGLDTDKPHVTSSGVYLTIVPLLWR